MTGPDDDLESTRRINEMRGLLMLVGQMAAETSEFHTALHLVLVESVVVHAKDPLMAMGVIAESLKETTVKALATLRMIEQLEQQDPPGRPN